MADVRALLDKSPELVGFLLAEFEGMAACQTLTHFAPLVRRYAAFGGESHAISTYP